MNLDDGRMLISPERYDALLKENGEAEMRRLQLVRVSPKFKVIALGLPVPRFPGNPLDPPLRSRFQNFLPDRQKARNVPSFSVRSLLDDLTRHTCLPPPLAKRLASLLTALRQLESRSADLVSQVPHFPDHALARLVNLLDSFPDRRDEAGLLPFLRRNFPFDEMCSPEEGDAIGAVFKTFGFDWNQQQRPYQLASVSVRPSTAHLTFVSKTGRLELSSPAGKQSVETQHFSSPLLSDLAEDHFLGQYVCLVGSKGEGKSHLAREFAAAFGYAPVEFIHLYKDMTARDLIQRRGTDSEGNTVWKLSPLVRAALTGGLVILDGLHKLHRGTIAVLQTLVHEGELNLFNGEKLVTWRRYRQLNEARAADPEAAVSAGLVRPVHPAFRIICLAVPPTPKLKWLSSELLSMFTFHFLPPLTRLSKELLMVAAVPQVSRPALQQLLNLEEQLARLRAGDDSFTVALSIRQLLRICRHLEAYPLDSLASLLRREMMTTFMPPSTQAVVRGAISSCEIFEEEPTQSELVLTEAADSVSIGEVTVHRSKPDNPALVPSILFFNMKKHLAHLKEMLKDYLLGNHILLIGNQGVGKNKLADRLLELLNLEREYIQLHRDTTVQSLTLLPTVIDGVITWEDSPLVRAVRFGRVLMIDEADKAPLEVVGILKGLVEDGEMLLGDGRRILKKFDQTSVPASANEDVIPMHRDFRVIVLANRPGFPFLGNDFFAETGDCFSTHIVDNPDLDSELELLSKYAPNVSAATLQSLAALFADLRDLVDQGLLSYPYSTRELVNIVKHMQRFKEDGVMRTVENIFDFDAYSPDLRRYLVTTFQKHGIPLVDQEDDSKYSVQLAEEFPLPPAVDTERWTVHNNTRLVEADVKPIVQKANWPVTAGSLASAEYRPGRSHHFSEEKYSWLVRRNETPSAHRVTGLATLKDDVYVLMHQPLEVHVFLGPAHDRYLPINLAVHLPHFAAYSQGTPAIWAVPQAACVVVWIPATSTLIQLSNRSVIPLEVPGLGQNPVAVFNNKYFMNPSKAPGPVWRHERTTNPASGWLLLFREAQILVLDLTASRSTLLSLPDARDTKEAVQYAAWLHDNKLLVRTDRRRYVLDCDDNYWRARPLDISSLTGSPLLPPLLTHGSLPVVLNNATSYSQSLVPDDRQDRAYTLKSHTKDADRQYRQNELSLFVQESKQTINVIAGENWLEVADIRHSVVRVLSMEPRKSDTMAPGILALAELADGDVMVLQRDGVLRRLEVNIVRLTESLEQWRLVIGERSQLEDLAIKIESAGVLRNPGAVPKPELPKRGDFDGKEHARGNQFQGGSGGSDTEGLGGRGGARRLDVGQQVEQMSDEEKTEIAYEAQVAARAAAQEALKQRLADIELSAFSNEQYEKWQGRVGKEVSQLRSILETIEATRRPRLWLSNEVQGELDERKLVETIVGDSNVYKRRGEERPNPGEPQDLPKRIKFLMDVSGSMYRFNSQDGRLDRMIECSLMIMESFQGFAHRFVYEIIGHSGDGPDIRFVEAARPPANRAERFKILKKMIAHSEYCANGDNTLAALALARAAITAEEADDYFVFLVSDANLDRYDIKPASYSGSKSLEETNRSLPALTHFAEALAGEMMKDPRVHVYAFFIASLAEQAAKLQASLPVGHGWVCLDLATLPAIFRQIFQTNLLKSQL